MPSEAIFLERDPRYDEHNPHLLFPVETPMPDHPVGECTTCHTRAPLFHPYCQPEIGLCLKCHEAEPYNKHTGNTTARTASIAMHTFAQYKYDQELAHLRRTHPPEYCI